MWIKRNTNKPFPKFHCNPVGSRSGKYMGRNMKISQNKSKTSVSPNFIVRATPPPTLSLFLDTLWWTLVNKSCSTSILLYVGGLINRFPPFWCPTSHSILPLLFLHHGGRGCGSRLSICQLNIYNKYWDGNAVYFGALAAEMEAQYIPVSTCNIPYSRQLMDGGHLACWDSI